MSMNNEAYAMQEVSRLLVENNEDGALILDVGYGGTDVESFSFPASDDDDKSLHVGPLRLPPIRRIALKLSLYFNLAITMTKLMAYFQTTSLSVLAALLDSLLDVVSQFVLSYMEKHSSKQRSSALYPAGAARLEPIGVLTCAALMGMSSFEVLKESTAQLIYRSTDLNEIPSLFSFWTMSGIVIVKLGLLWLCRRGANRRAIVTYGEKQLSIASKAVLLELDDPTMEALAQDHFNDILSNSVAAIALLFALRSPSLWFLDPVGAIIISLYIIYSWYQTGQEQIQHLTGKGAPDEYIEDLKRMASAFDERVQVDKIRAYHFGPKFLVELEVVMPKQTLLLESHDVGMELQYEIESREEVERCFVHIDCKPHVSVPVMDHRGNSSNHLLLAFLVHFQMNRDLMMNTWFRRFPICVKNIDRPADEIQDIACKYEL